MLMQWWEWGRCVAGPELCDTDKDRPCITLQVKMRNWGFSLREWLSSNHWKV